MLVRILSLPLDNIYEAMYLTDFNNVDSWAKPYLYAFIDSRINSEPLHNEQMVLSANNPISRQDMVVMSLHALNLDDFDKTNINIQIDDIYEIEDINEIDDFAIDYIMYALSKDMLNINDNKIRPHDNAKRSEAAYFFGKAFYYYIWNNN